MLDDENARIILLFMFIFFASSDWNQMRSPQFVYSAD